MVSLEQEWRSGKCFSCFPLVSPRILSLFMPELENSTAKRVGHAKRQDETGGVSDHLLQRESHYSLLNAVAVVVTIVAILIIIMVLSPLVENSEPGINI